MRFLHISDTHLGYRQYGLIEREQDFLDVFDEAIDIAINENVDFIIHTGDFFHTSRPSNKTIIDSINLLKKLSDKNIPIFCIPGNHDRGNSVKDISPLQILENFGLNLINSGVKEFNGIDIVGVKYIPKTALRKLNGLKVALEKLLERSKQNYKILMLHQEFYPYFLDSKLMLDEEIPIEYNYTGIGHYHIAEEPIKRDNSSYIVHIGSTEFTAYNKNEESKSKFVALVDINSDETDIRYIELNKRRKFLYRFLDDNNIDEELDKLNKEIEKLNDTSIKKPVVILKGEFKKLSQNEVLKLLKEKNIDVDNGRILYLKNMFIFPSNSLDYKGEIFKSEDEIIKSSLTEYLKDDLELKDKLLELINTLKSFDDLDTVKAYLKENPEVIENLIK